MPGDRRVWRGPLSPDQRAFDIPRNINFLRIIPHITPTTLCPAPLIAPEPEGRLRGYRGNLSSPEETMIRASLTPRITPLSAAAAAITALGLGTSALAGAPSQSPRPEARPAMAATATAPRATAADGGAVLNPWGNSQYERVWRAGDRIGSFNFHLLTSYRRYRLPSPPAGQAYVALGTQVLRVDTHNWKVVASVGKVDKIFGLG